MIERAIHERPYGSPQRLKRRDRQRSRLARHDLNQRDDGRWDSGVEALLSIYICHTASATNRLRRILTIVEAEVANNSEQLHRAQNRLRWKREVHTHVEDGSAAAHELRLAESRSQLLWVQSARAAQNLGVPVRRLSASSWAGPATAVQSSESEVRLLRSASSAELSRAESGWPASTRCAG